jgi:hypothetical protein
MFPGLRIGSRWGNRFICVLGALFTTASIALLLYYLVSSWDGATLTDRALQFCLFVAIIVGVAFVVIGRDNLKRPHTSP